MLLALIQNDLTGTVSQIGNLTADEFSVLRGVVLGNIKSNRVSRFQFDNFTVFSLNEIRYKRDSGEIVTDYVDIEFARLMAEYQVSLVVDQTDGFVDFSHDVQYFVGAARNYSEIIEGNEDNSGYLRERLQRIRDVANVFIQRASYYRYTTEGIGGAEAKEFVFYDKVRTISDSLRVIGTRYKKSITFSIIGDKKVSVRLSDFFDFVPFAIVENAVKYGPSTGVGIIFGISNLREGLLFEIGSMGPIIRESEKQQLFKKRIRAASAVALKVPGTGSGLYTANIGARKLFGGNLGLVQHRPLYVHQGIEYCKTVFSVWIPSTHVVK